MKLKWLTSFKKILLTSNYRQRKQQQQKKLQASFIESFDKLLQIKKHQFHKSTQKL